MGLLAMLTLCCIASQFNGLALQSIPLQWCPGLPEIRFAYLWNFMHGIPLPNSVLQRTCSGRSFTSASAWPFQRNLDLGLLTAGRADRVGGEADKHARGGRAAVLRLRRHWAGARGARDPPSPLCMRLRPATSRAVCKRMV